MNPDAIFGFIDPRETNNIKLKQMFNVTSMRQMKLINAPRGDSAQKWNDKSEFATPNIMAAEKEN